MHLNYGNDGVLNINNMEINLSSKKSNQIEQGFQNNDKQQEFSQVLKFVKLKTAFMRTLFKLMYSLIEVLSKIHLLKRFEWWDMFAKLREKNCVIHINTAYKQKVDKIKPVNLKKTIGEVSGKLSN